MIRRTFSWAWVSLVVLHALAGLARADVKLPAILGDHMVLQQKTEAPIWGWADPGEKVTVTLQGASNTAAGKPASATATAGTDGKWMVKIATPAAGGPYSLTVAGKNTLTLSDLLVGEVWVCSGQSNMQWSVAQAANPDEEIAAAKYPQIRLFTVERKISQEPVVDCAGAWAACTPEVAKDFSAVGYFFGRQLNKELGVPVGLVDNAWGGTICEAWTSRPSLESDADFQPILERGATFNPTNPNQPSVLYNGLINPLLPLAIRGAIWYQGESNVGRAAQYRKLFPTMIADWRKSWGQGDFPFYFVQLAPYRYGKNDPALCAELWEAQLKSLSVPNTGMAVTTDIGNTKDIHPKNKQEVGRRLALWALAKTYGKSDLLYSGPLNDSAKVEGNKIRVAFQHVGGGLVAKGGELTNFTIAGEDGKFVEAQAKIDGNAVIVSSDQVAKPVAVRFAWSDTAEPNLFNTEGLPASPFRTDDFKLLTADNK